DVFAYIYGLLHHKSYTGKYADNLRRELPRIPIRHDFYEILKLGQKLLDLHLGWDTGICPKSHYKLQTQVPQKAVKTVKYSLKSRPSEGIIEISNALKVVGIPRTAWDYKLGGRSAIDWVLEFYKESKNRYKDESLAGLVAQGKLPEYRLADYEAELLDTLERVIHISVETQALLAHTY
ncbi:MAG: type ISP restriction/modification enzyme, partial [Spirochaetota bacterium]